jgi:hypothetical protein
MVLVFEKLEDFMRGFLPGDVHKYCHFKSKNMFGSDALSWVFHLHRSIKSAKTKLGQETKLARIDRQCLSYNLKK